MATMHGQNQFEDALFPVFAMYVGAPKSVNLMGMMAFVAPCLLGKGAA
jgi:hypothetical protein